VIFPPPLPFRSFPFPLIDEEEGLLTCRSFHCAPNSSFLINSPLLPPGPPLHSPLSHPLSPILAGVIIATGCVGVLGALHLCSERIPGFDAVSKGFRSYFSLRSRPSCGKLIRKVYPAKGWARPRRSPLRTLFPQV